MSQHLVRKWTLLSTLVYSLSAKQQIPLLSLELANLLKGLADCRHAPEEANSLIASIQENKLPDIIRAQADKTMAWAERPEHFLIPYTGENYPVLLRMTVNPPPLLYVAGDPELLSLPQLAIVGSRKPSADGRKIAAQFAAGMSEAGFLITSGLALGIDTAAHQGALEAKQRTVAVLGTGLDRIYPKNNEKLARYIIEAGVLVSEFPLDTGPLPWHFPQRNRIISGLSHGVLVVEAAKASGSLITARLAAEQGREVFVIPGSIRNPLTKGCHSLIRQGATLVESVSDILTELASLVQWEHTNRTEQLAENTDYKRKAHEGAFTREQKTIMSSIAYSPLSVDNLVEATGINIACLQAELIKLELEGHVICEAGTYMRVY